MTPDVELVVLARSHGALDGTVRAAIAAQQGVRIRVHRLVGSPRPGDACRWETIARARNQGKLLGKSPWLMFLDDDVVLETGCVRKLLDALERRPRYGALAADYLREGRKGEVSRHVAMGATLFRRSTLRRFQFRWEVDRCECQCCCDDLRRQGLAIGYFAAARAQHLNSCKPRTHHAAAAQTPTVPVSGNVAKNRSVKYCRRQIRQHLDSRSMRPKSGDFGYCQVGQPVILAAFDRRHFRKFQRQFMFSLRGAGNVETVIAFCYGLHPSERRTLSRLPDVRVVALPKCGREQPPKRRLRDFQTVVADLAPNTPVAYWDAGDVVFQNLLAGLWRQVRATPNKLLTASEPVHHPENRSVANWTLSIRDPDARRRAFGLLSRRPVLNSGFAAGTAATMLKYLRAADQLLHSPAMAGSTDWGDQTTLNLYCHTQPMVWREVGEGWNFCLYGREPGELAVDEDRRLVGRKGAAVHVIHGNARTLPAHYYGLGAAPPAGGADEAIAARPIATAGQVDRPLW